MKHAKFGHDGRWKPFQRGFLISTTSVLQLSKFLLTEKGFKYFLPSRGLQDCLENLFSTVRFDNPKPNAIQVRDSIKNISISEYLLQPVRNCSYEWDDSMFLSGFLNIVRSVRHAHRKESESVQKMINWNCVMWPLTLIFLKLSLTDASKTCFTKFAVTFCIRSRLQSRRRCTVTPACLSVVHQAWTKQKKITMLMQQPDFKYSSRN